MSDARRSSGLKLFAWAFVACCLVATAAAQAVTQDITSQFAITRSGLVLNRTTSTFDSTVTLKNTSGAGILAPIDVVVSGLPTGVTLANKVADKPDGRPYVSPMTAGSLLQDRGTLSFVLKFLNPSRVSFTTTLQILRTVEVPASAPSLIGAVATAGNTAYLIGRVDGAVNQDITVQASSATSCVSGTLVGTVTPGASVAARTDEEGYFGVTVSGVDVGQSVALKTTGTTASPLSLCQVSSRDNDSWPKAFPLDSTGLTASDFIDLPGKARWYRISVTPGQRIQVVLSNLPADYDLAVFKDIGQAFLNQFNPATATAGDLVKLAAEYAPSTFSPSTFSPSTFSPDAYTPSTFSPSTFSSSLFSPSTFSPSTFSPSTFSPSTFSPSTFSPSTFSPSTFSPFSPSVYTQAEVEQAFSTAQTKSIIAVAATPGTGSELAVVNTWNNTGNFYIRVTGRDGAFSTSTQFTVTVTKGPTTCTGVTDTILTARTPASASGLKTVILTDSSKIALDDQLLVPGGGTLRGKLAAFAGRAEVKGVVVDVAGDARVGVLKGQAAANSACPFAKNLVAEEIKSIVDSFRANPLQYVVIVGNDNTIPFFRTPDQSLLGQESTFVPPVQSDSASEASLRRDFVLSQDGYGSKTRISLPSTDFPVPGLAVGRLIETTSEIAGIIDAYVAANGAVVPHTSLVTGYDFLEDAAIAVRTELQTGTGGVADALITPNGKSPQDPLSWTATQLGAQLLGSRHDVIFLAGHFSANSALAADFSTNLLTTELAASSVDLTNSIVFSAGCHSGYNLVDIDGIPGVTMTLDWAQAFARKKATLVAGTGYQYGDTDFLEYSERLYKNFARQLRAGTAGTPIAVGEALVQAKLDYLATTPDIRGIHEKALLEATLFGLPMLGVNMPAGRDPVAGTGGVITPVAVTWPPGAPPALVSLGLKTFDLSVAPTFTSHTISLKNIEGGSDISATWLEGPDGVVTKPSEPALPLDVVNVTPTDASVVLRGVGFRGGTYADSLPIYTFSGAPTTELRGVHVPFNSPVFFPGRMWSPNYFGALAGNGGTQLLVTPAQHRGANFVAGTSTQRRFTGLNMRLYYSGDLSKAALSDAPTIVSVEAQRISGDVLFTVGVVGDPAAAIHQVWITYTTDGGSVWTSLDDLSQCVRPAPADPLPVACGTTDDSRIWKGQLASAPSNLRYMAQAVSGIGLVAVDDSLGAYHGVDAVTPAATTLALVSPPTSAAIGATIDIKAKLAYGGVAIAGKRVLIAVGGVGYTGTTGSDGSATVPVPVAAAPGSYLITASFAGDDNYLPSSTTTAFQVTFAPSSLAGLAPAGVTLTGILGGTTQVLQAEPVSFLVTGPGGTRIIWVTTDYLGHAKLPPTGLPGGDYTVTNASYGGNATFAAASLSFAPGQQFAVAKIPQTLDFDALDDVAFGGSAVLMYAPASSGLPVSYAASGQCSAAGNRVTVSGLGTCTVTASQAGDAVYAAATAQRTFAIIKANQAIAFAPAPGGVTVGQPLVMIGASSSSLTAPPSTIPITYSSSPSTICTMGGVNGTMLTLLATGTCRITANQSGDGFYNAAPPVTLDVAVAASGSPSVTFTVTNTNNSGLGSLRTAIANANAAAPGPNIVNFTPGLTGTIVLTSQIQISRSVSIVGPGAGNLTIDGNGVANTSAFSRIFSIFATDPACPALDGPDYLVSISGLRLTNGRNKSAGGTGGAIFTEHSLALDSVIIDNSVATRGGGVTFLAQYQGQSLSISNSKFLNNMATELVPPPTSNNTSSGGGLNIQDRCTGPVDTITDIPTVTPVTITIANSEFRGNSSQPVTLYGRGGAIRSYSLADITISDTIIVDNHVDAPNPPVAGKNYLGGGFQGTAKSLRIERSEIAENTAYDVTGADVTRGGGLRVDNNAVTRQGPGGAMAVKIINSTISGNASSATAGGIQAFANVALELDNSTISDNLAPPTRTGGINMTSGDTYPVSGSNTTAPTLTLVSTILSDNSGDGGDISHNAALIPTFTINAANSLIEKPCPTCAVFVQGSGNLIGVDPVLGPLAYNGGTTRTHALLAGSPAIDAGSNPLGLATDQRSATDSPRLVGVGVDMGAYEAISTAPFTAYVYLSQFGSQGSGNGQFQFATDVAIDPTSRNIVVVDGGNHRVQIFSSAGVYLSQFGSQGSGDGQFQFPRAVAIDPTSRNIVVVDGGNHRVQIFSSAGVYLSQFGSEGSGNGQFQQANGVAIDPTSHNIVVTDVGPRRVQIFSSAGVFLSQFGSIGQGNGQFETVGGVAIDPTSRNIVVADGGNQRVQIFSSAGVYLSQFGSEGSGNGQFEYPYHVAIDPTSRNIIVGADLDSRVQIFSSAGAYLSQFGTFGTGDGQFNVATAVAIDPTSHNIVVIDSGQSSRVQIFAPQ